MLLLAELVVAFTMLTSPSYKDRVGGYHRLMTSGMSWEPLVEIYVSLHDKKLFEEAYWFKKAAWEQYVWENEHIYLEWNNRLDEKKMRFNFQQEIELTIRERRRK